MRLEKILIIQLKLGKVYLISIKVIAKAAITVLLDPDLDGQCSFTQQSHQSISKLINAL